MLRAALLILSGNAFASLLLLARNLIVARFIPVADYGIAATFAVIMAVVEMMSALGLQQQIVQAKEGDEPYFQAALQGFQLLRGVISGIALFAIAGPVAHFMGIPQVIWAYQLLAVVPVLNALIHFDIHRLSRGMVFGPMLLTGAIPALVSLLAVWPLAVWLGDYRVMLYSILIQTALGAVTSHLVARRPYRAVLDRKIMGRSLRFGWPILVNGLLMFLVFNGDKAIVGRELGMETLAIFAMGVTLTLTPTLVLAASAVNFFLPQLSVARHAADGEFDRHAVAMLQAILAMSLLFVCGTVLFGPLIVHLLAGEKFAALQPLMGWFAIMQALRVLKTGPSIVALAVGQTSNPMIANIPRVLVLPLCWYVAAHSGDIFTIIWIATLGEFAGYLLAMLLLRRWVALSQRGIVLPHLAAAILLLVTVAIGLWQPTAALSGQPDARVAVVLLVIYALNLASQRELFLYVRQRKTSGEVS